MPPTYPLRILPYSYDDVEEDAPASLVIGGISSGSFKGYVVLPDQSDKVRDCVFYVVESTAEKFTLLGLVIYLTPLPALFSFQFLSVYLCVKSLLPLSTTCNHQIKYNLSISHLPSTRTGLPHLLQHVQQVCQKGVVMRSALPGWRGSGGSLVSLCDHRPRYCLL